jgi:hypothetical protein
MYWGDFISLQLLIMCWTRSFFPHLPTLHNIPTSTVVGEIYFWAASDDILSRLSLLNY